MDLPPSHDSGKHKWSTSMYYFGFGNTWLAHIQACLYATVDAWAQLARQEHIRWAACGGSLFGALCYHAMPAWDDDVDITVPEEDCWRLDRIWDRANATMSASADDPRPYGAAPLMAAPANGWGGI